MCPSSAAQDSSVRQEVVPTQMHRPPALPGLVDEVAVSWGMVPVLAVHGVVLNGVLLHGPEGARPTWSVTYPIFTPLARIFSSSSGVKWSPAVGAAALPSTLEYTV